MEGDPLKVLETDRLSLRWLGIEDAPFIFGLVNEPSWLRFIGDKGVRTMGDARRYIVDGPVASYARFGFGLYMVELKASATPIGICGLLRRDALNDPDVGFAFLPAYWGSGYGYESAAAVLAFGREALRLSRIVAITDPDNARSIRLLKKLGLRFDRMTRLSADAPEVALFSPGGSIALRRLDPGDAELALRAARELKITDPVLRDALTLEHARTFLENADNVLLVATDGDRPIGFLLAYCLDRIDRDRPMMLFYEIEVASSHRRRGVGRALVERLIALCAERNVLKMWVHTNRSNSAAMSLYRSTGGVPDASGDEVTFLYVPSPGQGGGTSKSTG